MEKNLSQVPINVPYQQEESVFLQKWLRYKHSVVFRLSNNSIQMNFQDHTKIILGEFGKVITYITSQKHVYSCSIDEALVPKDIQTQMLQMTSLNELNWPPSCTVIKMSPSLLTNDICRDICLRIHKVVEFLHVLNNK